MVIVVVRLAEGPVTLRCHLVVQLCRNMSLLGFEQFTGNIATFDSS